MFHFPTTVFASLLHSSLLLSKFFLVLFLLFFTTLKKNWWMNSPLCIITQGPCLVWCSQSFEILQLTPHFSRAPSVPTCQSSSASRLAVIRSLIQVSSTSPVRADWMMDTSCLRLAATRPLSFRRFCEEIGFIGWLINADIRISFIFLFLSTLQGIPWKKTDVKNKAPCHLTFPCSLPHT